MDQDGPEFEVDDPDDEELRQTDPGIIEMLGFDPKEFSNDGKTPIVTRGARH